MGFQKSFKALGDPVRREILSLLRREPMAAGDIAAHFDLSGATVSHHLAILRDAGLVLDDRQGKYIYYELNMSVVDEILEWVSALRGEDRDEKTNKTNKKQAAAWVLSLLPLVMIAAVYRRLPAEVPMHWDLDGAVDYGAKAQLWVIAAMAPVLEAMFCFLPKIDPKNKITVSSATPILAFSL